MLVLIFGLERFAPRAPAPLIAVAVAIVGSGLLGLQRGRRGDGRRASRSGLPTLVWPHLDLVGADVARGGRHRADELHRDDRRGARVRRAPASRGPSRTGSCSRSASPTSPAACSARCRPAAARRRRRSTARPARGRRWPSSSPRRRPLATLLLLAPVIALMPQAALAAVVVAYSLELIKPAEFREIRRVRRTEFRWALIAFAGVVLLGTLKGILVAVIVSLLALAQQAYNPPVYALGRKRGTHVFRPLSDEHPDDETWPGLLILRVEGRAVLRQRAARRRQDVAAGRAGEAVGRAARLQRRVRHRVHRAQDARRGGGAAAPATASRCGWRRSIRRCWRSSQRSRLGETLGPRADVLQRAGCGREVRAARGLERNQTAS